MGCQYHMARYAYLFETTLLADGSAILPVTEETGTSPIVPKHIILTTTPIGEKAGLKAIVETIDNRNDFKTFMQNFTVARGSQRGPSRNVPYDDGSVCDVLKWNGLVTNRTYQNSSCQLCHRMSTHHIMVSRNHHSKHTIRTLNNILLQRLPPYTATVTLSTLITAKASAYHRSNHLQLV
jgi:hypothetical protein